ncbi:hypothetical protein RHAA1_02329 [Aggregatibacter actinomycetemcomitans RhAA1]|nr:hypothetical protein RHAA1_02329 [Aggregatibacter actinomycetemcomitans RhAA1]
MVFYHVLSKSDAQWCVNFDDFIFFNDLSIIPIFLKQKFSKLQQARNNLNSLGNLFRLAIKSNIPVEE